MKKTHFQDSKHYGKPGPVTRRATQEEHADDDLEAFDLAYDPALSRRSTVNRKSIFVKGGQGQFRQNLPSIEAYQQALQFPVDAPGRVILRLERLMGTSNIRPVDSKYMKSLRGKLEEEEKVTWKNRMRSRKDKEYERCRKLVIDGHADPPHGMESIYQHPVFRVNRIMDRLADIDTAIGKEFHVKPPPIQEVEPFEELKETGFLFGSHPRHYLKVKQAQDKVNLGLEEEDKEPDLIYHSPQFDGDGKLLPPQEVPTVKASEPIGIEPATRPHSPTTETVPATSDLKKQKNAKSVRADIEAAKLKYGINPDDIEKMWKAYESPLIKMINKEEDGIPLLDVASRVLGSAQRENRYAEDFANNTYARILTNA